MIPQAFRHLALRIRMKTPVFVSRTIAASPPGGFVSALGSALFMLAVLGLALPTALVAMGEGAGTLRLPFNLHVVDLRLPGVFKLHMLASGLALLLIPAVIWTRRDRTLHKALGRATAACVLAGALTALPVAVLSDSIAIARAGFFAQGVVWLALIKGGVRAIRARRIADHRAYMLAMAAVASGAIWVRLATAVATAWDLPFEPIYGLAAWLGWLIPLALVHKALGTRRPETPLADHFAFD
jgi:uncharacterized membrane protein